MNRTRGWLRRDLLFALDGNQRRCAALAVGNNRTLYGSAWNGDLGLARYHALQTCIAQDAGCQVVFSLCSF